MTAELDTVLVALCVLTDDHMTPSVKRGPGRPKKLSDAELARLAVAQVLLGARSEHHWLLLCYARLGRIFPYLPRQPGYPSGSRQPGRGGGLPARECPSWHDQVWLIDVTPVSYGSSWETVRRSELPGLAHYDYCACYSR